MKGIIFNLFERVVDDEFGEDVWDDVLDRAGIVGAYTAVGTYPHEELEALVGAASAAVGMPSDDLIRWFGRRAMPLLVERHPDFFSIHNSTIPFLLTLNDVIHPEVRKLFPGAYAPDFDFDQVDENTLALEYHSYRNLCAFGEGLIQGAADHYQEDVDVAQTRCTRRGDDRCLYLCRFSPRR